MVTVMGLGFPELQYVGSACFAKHLRETRTFTIHLDSYDGPPVMVHGVAA